VSTVEYAHISIDADNVPTLTGTRIKVVEIVLDHLARGWQIGERFATAWKSNCARHRMATKPLYFAAAVIAGKKKRPCTTAISPG
jgi:hypothetical protein